MRPFADRFWERVAIGKPNDCWLWIGARTGKYGCYNSTEHGHEYAHRISFALKHGWDSLIPGFVIGHKCDNPLCVNPNHLERITGAKNGHDATMRGRKGTPRIIAPGAGKLSPKAIREIRKTELTHVSIGRMMTKHNIGEGTVINIVKRIYHKEIED